jgi:hypothetical protein
VNWIKVYDLANDKDYIHLVKQADIRWTKESGDAGQDRPLVGFPEWWKTVESGELESHWVTGTIKRPLWTGMNDFPEVEVEEESGSISLWPRRGDVTEYSKGRGIRIRWVAQKRVKPIEDMAEEMTVVVEVWLQAGAWRRTAEYGAGPGRSLDEGWEGGPA